MSSQERPRGSDGTVTDIPSWQREIEVAYVYLIKDQVGIEFSEPGSVEEEALIMRVVTRTRNFINVLGAASQYGVKRVPDVIPLPSSAPRVKTYYFSHNNEVKNIRVIGNLLKREDYEHAEVVTPSVWVKDKMKMEALMTVLTTLVPFEDKSRIMDAAIDDTEPVDLS